MTPGDIIEVAEEDGVQLTLSRAGGISAKGLKSAIDCWLPAIRQSKAAIVEKLVLEGRRARVIAELLENPDFRYVIEVMDPDTDPVIISIGIRGLATFEIKVPQARYNPFALLQLLEQYPSWLSDDD
ncbi:MAG: hypothetical protein H6991_04625 [Pseudomonadales bacterium]|nr:hypothetical protein [Pseudomonadales bacterium]